MARLLRMPEVAANATDAVLEEWSVAEHAAFSAEQTLATVETDKAVVDVEAESAGVLLRTLVPAGARVEVGAPIAVLGDPGEQVTDVDALLDELGVAPDAPSVDPQLRMVPDDPEGGTANTGGPVPAAAAASTRPEKSQEVVAPGSGNGSAGASASGRVSASPLARRMAREAGLALEQIAGSGPRGRVVRRDVEAARNGAGGSEPAGYRPQQSARPDGAAVVTTTPTSPAPPVPPATYTEVPHSRMRAAIASRLSSSKQTTPHFYLRGTARVDRLMSLRTELNEAAETPVSVNDLVVKAAAASHLAVPAMNVIWTEEAMRVFRSVDISLAVATDKGLVTPVLRSVDRLSISAVAATARDLATRARAGRLRQEELEGGSFTVTNLGMFGTEEFAAIINPPQSAILAVGAARSEAVVQGDRVQPGTVMTVTLSVDHRAVDGAVAAEWMRTFLALVEHPVRILA